MVDQVHELQETKQFTKKSWVTSFMQRQFLDDLSKKTKLFGPNADLDSYAKLIVKLKGLPEINSLSKLAVIAFTLTDPSKFFKPEVLNLYNTQIRTSEEFIDLAGLIEILQSMALFCSKNIV